MAGDPGINGLPGAQQLSGPLGLAPGAAGAGACGGPSAARNLVLPAGPDDPHRVRMLRRPVEDLVRAEGPGELEVLSDQQGPVDRGDRVPRGDGLGGEEAVGDPEICPRSVGLADILDPYTPSLF